MKIDEEWGLVRGPSFFNAEDGKKKNSFLKGMEPLIIKET